jgi:hypothetical protein
MGLTRSYSVLASFGLKEGNVTNIQTKADRPHYDRRCSSTRVAVLFRVAGAADPERAAVERDAATLMHVARFAAHPL